MKPAVSLRSILLLLSLLFIVGLVGYRLELAIPTRAPKLDTTFTPIMQPTPQEVGSYDVLGIQVSKAEADRLQQTEAGRVQLAPENGAVTAPYLHDGGVAAFTDALKQEADGSYSVADPKRMGLAGTSMQQIAPDPETSLRVLVDRNLRKVAVTANRANPDLQASHIDGSGHNYWVDRQAGFTPEDQTALVQFLLSIDDNPAILPDSVQSSR